MDKAEKLTCPKCGETLKPGATKLAKLSDDFHDVFRCPACKHISSPASELPLELSSRARFLPHFVATKVT